MYISFSAVLPQDGRVEALDRTWHDTEEEGGEGGRDEGLGVELK